MEEEEIEIEEFPALSEDFERQDSEDREESDVWEPSWEAETGHHFYIRSFKKPTYCQVCQNFIWGLRKQALYCEVCSFTIHEKCLSKVKICCFIPSIVEGHDYNESIVMKHNWINGNLSIGSRCVVCTKSSQNMSGSFNSYRCSRCNLTAHSDCQINAPNCSIPLLSLIFCHELMKKSYAKYYPLLIFVNSKSGGQQGPSIMRKFKKLLSAEQVIDLFDHKPVGPLQALEKYVRVPNLKILVCGGDGTACWVWSVLDKMENLPEKIPPIAMIPLGTGNDLARVLNFGGGYENEPIKPILLHILNRSIELLLDRWDIVIEEEDGARKEWVLNNYFSFGLDAKIALKFHETREENPQLFKSRTINKGFYGTFGLQNIIVHPHTIKELNFSLNVDGQDIDLSRYEGLECIVFLNIPSYAGGTNLWGNTQDGDSWSPCLMNDGKLEVIGLNNAAHLVGLQTGLVHGVKLAQGSNITFEVDAVEVQVDGEPFRIKKSKVSISLYKKSNVLQLIKHDK